MTRRRPPSRDDAPPAPAPREEGLIGAIRRNKRLKKATEPKNDARRQIAERVKDFMRGSSSEDRDVPHPFDGSIYGDDDESEN